MGSVPSARRYDATGRLKEASCPSGGAAPANATSGSVGYDDLGRLASVTRRGAWPTHPIQLRAQQRLVGSAAEAVGTVTTTVDLLGRGFSYTDAPAGQPRPPPTTRPAATHGSQYGYDPGRPPSL